MLAHKVNVCIVPKMTLSLGEKFILKMLCIKFGNLNSAPFNECMCRDSLHF